MSVSLLTLPSFLLSFPPSFLPPPLSFFLLFIWKASWGQTASSLLRWPPCPRLGYAGTRTQKYRLPAGLPLSRLLLPFRAHQWELGQRQKSHSTDEVFIWVPMCLPHLLPQRQAPGCILGTGRSGGSWACAVTQCPTRPSARNTVSLKAWLELALSLSLAVLPLLSSKTTSAQVASTPRAQFSCLFFIIYF